MLTTSTAFFGARDAWHVRLNARSSLRKRDVLTIGDFELVTPQDDTTIRLEAGSKGDRSIGAGNATSESERVGTTTVIDISVSAAGRAVDLDDTKSYRERV